MVQRHRMRIGWPLRFSDGERIVAVLSSELVPLSRTDIDVTVLVEMPAGYDPEEARKERKP
jgi:hypothetical protein